MASSRPVNDTGWNDRKLILLGIVERELDDPPHLLVVDAVDDGDDRHDLDAGGVQVLDGLQLNVEQVAYGAVRIGRIADAVELQVGIAHAGFRRLLAELQALGELDAVGRRLHASCNPTLRA